MADEPGFADAPSFISELQMTHSLSPDKKALTILFDNFVAKLQPGSGPLVMRTLSLVLPLKNVAAGATLTGGLQGGGAMNPGTSGMLIFRAGGISHVFDPLFDAPDATGFTKEINLTVPASGDLRMTIILALEGSATDPRAEAEIDIDSVDLTIGPAQPDLHV
jgi:hypothetical protein